MSKRKCPNTMCWTYETSLQVIHCYWRRDCPLCGFALACANLPTPRHEHCHHRCALPGDQVPHLLLRCRQEPNLLGHRLLCLTLFKHSTPEKLHDQACWSGWVENSFSTCLKSVCRRCWCHLCLRGRRSSHFWICHSALQQNIHCGQYAKTDKTTNICSFTDNELERGRCLPGGWYFPGSHSCLRNLYPRISQVSIRKHPEESGQLDIRLHSEQPCFQEERVEEPGAKCCDNIIHSIRPLLML